MIGPAAAPLATTPGWRNVSSRHFAEGSLAVLVFLGGFVIFEPAPYELALVGLLVGWVIAGLKISRYILPLLLLLLAYVVGGLIGLGVVEDLGDPVLYMATTALLAISAILFAAVIAVDPERRLRIIIRAYVAAGAVSATIGILGYFGLLPAAEFFTLYDRARGTFQDPNVFGPFLILPFAYLIHEIFTQGFRASRWRIVGTFLLLTALFLTFSRAAWGLTAFAVIMIGIVAFINQRNGVGRARVITYLAVGSVLAASLIVIVVSLPGTDALFDERAQLVQSYDTGDLGRFDRISQGFQLMLDKPLGLGPFGFGDIFGQDEHNMWLKGFSVYGWLGGFAYIALAVWTVAISVPLLFKRRPWQPVVVCALVTLVGHLVIHAVIDNDHWRHLFLLYGILWGAFAAERMIGRRGRADSVQGNIQIFRAAIARAPQFV